TTPLVHSPGSYSIFHMTYVICHMEYGICIGRIGFEPTISRLRAERVNRLHQRPAISMRPAGFEPATSRLSTVRYCQLSYRRKTGWEGRDRTYNLRFQGPLRYQIALLPSKNLLIQPLFKSMMT